jgi:hypothetical protein
VRAWASQVRFLHGLPANRTRTIFYEDMLAAQERGQPGLTGYLGWLLRQAGATDGEQCEWRSTEAAERDRHVQKVHAAELSGWVSNVDEVVRLFAERYPASQVSFASMAKAGGVESGMLQRWRSGSPAASSKDEDASGGSIGPTNALQPPPDIP